MEDLTIYLAGEIHSDWRDELRRHLDALDIPDLDAFAAVTVETLEQAAEAVAYIFE